MLKLAYFSPLSPQRSGISDYSEALLPHLATGAEIDLFVDGFVPSNKDLTNSFTVFDHKKDPTVLTRLTNYDAVVYHMGNDHRYHKEIYRVACQTPGILVLHDYALQHFFWGLVQTEKDGAKIYLDEMEAQSGRSERRLAQNFLQVNGTPPHLLHPVEYPLNYTLASRSEAVIVHSDWSRTRLEKVIPTASVRQIPHIIFDGQGNRSVRTKSDTVRIASFGMVTPDKGIERALRVLAKLKDRFDFRYTLVGEVSQNFGINELIRKFGLRDRVEIVEWAPIEEFVRRISETDIAINLREQTVGETSGSLCRIMAAGVAGIVSDIGWFSELPDDCVVKIDMRSCTDQLLESYLTRLFEDEPLRARIGRNAQEYVYTNHLIEQCAAKYLEVIEDTVASRARRSIVVNVAEQIGELEIDKNTGSKFLPAVARMIAGLAPALSRSNGEPGIIPVPTRSESKTENGTTAKVAPLKATAPDQRPVRRTPLVEGLDYERGAINYVQQLDDHHRYYLHTKPFYNLGGSASDATFDLSNKPPKYLGDGMDVETHRYFCDFANIALVLGLPPGSTILDVGCGSGWLSEYFARLGYDVTGVDVSPELIEISRERLAKISYLADHDTKLQCRFETLNIERDALSKQFDAVICYDSLHHFVDEHSTMKNLARMTKPGGTLFILEGNKPDEGSEGAAELREVMEKYSTLESPFHPAYLHELLEQNGFMIVGDYISVNGLFRRDELGSDDRLPVEIEPVNYLLCKKVSTVPANHHLTDSRTPRNLSARFTLLTDATIKRADKEIVSWNPSVKAGSELQIPIEIENTGDTLWIAGRSAKEGVVMIGVKVLDGVGRIVSERHGSPPFSHPFPPGEKRRVVVGQQAPDQPGEYIIKIDLVAQHIAWFEERGSEPLLVKLNVTLAV